MLTMYIHLTRWFWICALFNLVGQVCCLLLYNMVLLTDTHPFFCSASNSLWHSIQLYVIVCWIEYQFDQYPLLNSYLMFFLALQTLDRVVCSTFRYRKAVQLFELTLDHTSSSLNEMWEPTLVNLGHALRKLK